MNKGGRDKINVELPWESVELLVKQTLTVDLMLTDPASDLHQAIAKVLNYYGGNVDEQ